MTWAAFIDLASWAALLSGGFFFVVGAIGLIRMPDVFTRMHASSVSETLGAGLLIAGMALQSGPTLVALKLAMILLVLLLTGPLATHALARAALHDGMEPLVGGKDGKLSQTPPEAAVQLYELDRARGRTARKGRPS